MSVAEVDEYLAAVPEPQRTTLNALRRTLRSLLPDADEGIGYGVPVFRVDAKGVAGFAAYATHCSYLPMSGSVLGALGDEVAGYRTSKGALQFAVDEPLPQTLVETLVRARQAEITASRRPGA